MDLKKRKHHSPSAQFVEQPSIADRSPKPPPYSIRSIPKIILILLSLLFSFVAVTFVYVMINGNFHILGFRGSEKSGTSTNTTKFLSTFQYVEITAAYMDELRKLNTVLLPISYSDSMYRIICENTRFSRMALREGRFPTGSITARIESPAITGVSFAKPGQNPEKHVYIMTIGVLPLYRRFGIGSHLLKELEVEAKTFNSEGHPFHLTALLLHVQYNNTAAIEFYSRNGFKMVKDIPNYYVTVQPRRAYLLAKEI